MATPPPAFLLFCGGAFIWLPSLNLETTGADAGLSLPETTRPITFLEPPHVSALFWSVRHTNLSPAPPRPTLLPSWLILPPLSLFPSLTVLSFESATSRAPLSSPTAPEAQRTWNSGNASGKHFSGRMK